MIIGCFPDDIEETSCHRVYAIAACERIACLHAHTRSCVGSQCEPAAQQGFSTRERVVFHQTRSARLNIRPYVPLIGDEHRHAATEPLGDRDTEILLMRGQNKYLRAV